MLWACRNLRSLSGDLIADFALIKPKPKRSFKVDLNIYCKSYLELQMVKHWLLKQKVNYKIGFMLFIKKPMPHQILSQVSQSVNYGGNSCIYLPYNYTKSELKLVKGLAEPGASRPAS